MGVRIAEVEAGTAEAVVLLSEAGTAVAAEVVPVLSAPVVLSAVAAVLSGCGSADAELEAGLVLGCYQLK